MPNFLVNKLIAACMLLLCAVSAQAQTVTAPRNFSIDDNSKFRDIRDAQLSPDGKWAVYVVRTVDTKADKAVTNLWMSRTDATEHVQLTFSGDVRGTPRWRPDGRQLTFLAARGNEEEKKRGAQLWSLELNGGEAQKLTEIVGGVSDYAWSPDGRRMVLAVDDADPAADPEKIKGWQRKTKPPIVIDRYHFKQDRDGYLGQLRTHLALFDPVSRKAEALTTGIYSERLPSWSPDGTRIAFFSKRGADPDRTSETTLFVMEANGAALPTPIATVTTNNAARPSWSADGKWIALLKGDEPRMSAYHRYRLAIVPSTAGATRVLTEQLDRGVQAGFGWSRDSRHLTFAVDDDGASYLARVDVNSGKIDKLTTGRRTVSGVSVTARGDVSFLGANAKTLPEVYVLNSATEQRVSSQNDGWLAEIKLGDTADFSSKSKDGTEVRGLISTPPDYKKGIRYPTLLLIHGGPNGQDAHQLSALREVMTARGYVVMQVNYRGSSGRGDAFQKAIYADWGNKEVMDLIGAVDWAVAAGIADPARLGLGGWSYGGILTNYVIAQDTRFKAAVSGASSGNQISMFGTDQYILQYELELGPPWKSPDLWVKLSYPFFKADRIKTPTLFLSGELDFNVPTGGAEQMYQALKSTGVDTQLVIYPGQFHGITVPSYQRDVQQRFVGWFDKYLMPTTR